MPYETDLSRLKQLYDGGMPLSRAAGEIGISSATASNWFKKAGYKVTYRRTNSEGGVGKLQHVCDHCGTSYTATHSKSRFCSRACTNAWQRSDGPQAVATMRVYQPPVCPCGKTVEPTPGTTTRWVYTKKYCSAECRREYSINGNQRDPKNWATYTCRNPDCGQTFERRKNSRNAKHYCSLACSNKMTKKKHHIVLRDDDVVLDSSWEGLFYCACKFAKVPIERFDRKYGVQWDDNLDHWYAPDFWLPEIQAWVDRKGVAVEIKGHPDDDDPAKWAAFRADGWDLVVMDQYRMHHLSAHSVASVLRIAAGKDAVMARG